jgi:hypothetical protein
VKTIVVSGARSNIGKTHLARLLCVLLPGAVRVKIGSHARKPDGDSNLYEVGTSFATIAAENPDARFLVIESNRILQEITPDCTIYLPAEDAKPSAGIAIEKADIVRGTPVPEARISVLAERLECDEGVVRKIVELANERMKT